MKLGVVRCLEFGGMWWGCYVILGKFSVVLLMWLIMLVNRIVFIISGIFISWWLLKLVVFSLLIVVVFSVLCCCIRCRVNFIRVLMWVFLVNELLCSLCVCLVV